jgi:hypothetical protein
VRRLLTRRAVVGLDERAVVNAAQVLKVKCGLCHELKRNAQRVAVEPPVIVTEWLTGATFTHTAHSGLDCESCHRGLRNSVNTADVHMPKRSDCTSCHASGATAASTCITCHEYHVRSKPILAAALASPVAGGAPGSGGGEVRMIDKILLVTIALLVLVVLVPVGIALFQRLKPKADDRPAAPAPPRPAPPPLGKTPPAPTPGPAAAAPPIPAPQPARPMPPAAAAPVPAAPAVPPPPAAPFAADATRVENISDMRAPGGKASGSTEFVEWYGMILCTSGPLEGQRFVVDESGLYIGRDAALAQVVIPDGRVSKRHVRILPRAGKVWAIDQGSTNGTFIGSAPTQRITEVQLKRGDTIVLADNAASFTYQI